MGGAYPLDPSLPASDCRRCGVKPATVRFVDDTFAQPPTDLLLCGDCSEAEQGLQVGRMLQRSGTGFPDGFPDNLTDDQLRDLLRRFRDRGTWE